MNKEEIEHKLEQAKKDRMGINDNICWLKEQLAETEKPKFRQGDCIIEHEIPRIVLNKNIYKKQFASFSEHASDLNGYNYAEQHNGIVLFNAFDLMKGWSEPFENWESKPAYGDAIQIIIKVFEGGIFFGNLGDGATFDLENITEIHNKLGHAIADLKRKENK